MPPIVRIWRTLRQVLVAIPLIVGPLLAGGVDLNGPAVVAIAGVAVLIGSTVENTIRGTGPVPVIRTAIQVVVALAGIVPAVVAGLAEGGIHVDGPGLAAIAGAAVVLANVAMNLLEQNGTISTTLAAAAPLLGITKATQAAAGYVISDHVPDHGINPERRTDGPIRGAIRSLANRSKILGTTALRLAWAPGCKAKGTVYLAAFGALDAVFHHFGYGPRPEDTGAYNCRRITAGKGLSLHAFGPGDYFTFWNRVRIATSLAVDVNWTTNPYGPVLVTDMPVGMRDAAKRIRTNSGHQVWGLGADYRTNKDAMHYEIVCTPAQLATGIDPRTLPATTPVGATDHEVRWVPVFDGNTDAYIKSKGGFDHQVAESQLHLQYVGFYEGEIDGIHGDKTQKAVRAYKRWCIDLQRLAKSEVWPNADSTIGPKTIGALRWHRWKGIRHPRALAAAA